MGRAFDEGFSARLRRAGVIPGAFEWQQAVSKCIPCERQRSVRPREVESRNLRTGRGSERVDLRWSVDCCEVKARRWEVKMGA